MYGLVIFSNMQTDMIIFLDGYNRLIKKKKTLEDWGEWRTHRKPKFSGHGYPQTPIIYGETSTGNVLSEKK